VANLTELELKALKPGAGPVSDGGGLFGKVVETKKGVAVYFEYRYRGTNDKLRSVSCGAWPKQSLKRIRENHDNYRTDVRRGLDPAELIALAKLKDKADHAEAVAAERSRLTEVASKAARMTVRDLFDQWAAVDLKARRDGGAEARRMVEKDVLPAIGVMAVEDVRKGHVAAMLDKVKARGVARMVNVILSLTRQMFLFAVSRDYIEQDPTTTLKKAAFGGKETERERTLSEDEIRELRQRIQTARLSQPTALAVWIMLSTCCRVGELSTAEWSHVDLEAREWFIPGANTKNGDPLTVALSDFALEQFQQLRDVQLSARWLFPASKLDSEGSETHIDEKSITKQIKDRQRAKPLKGRTQSVDALLLSGGEWTPHDLRRTGATLMGDLGVDSDVIDRCLNHREQNRIKRTYQRSKRETDMAEAWKVLGERLALLSRPKSENVVPLPATKRK